MTYGLCTKSHWSMKHTHTHAKPYRYSRVIHHQLRRACPPNPFKGPLTSSMTFPKGHYIFIKLHNEHYNHHHSLCSALSQGKQKNIIYRPNKNTTTLSASCRDLPSHHISPFSYYSWQLTLSLNLALLPLYFSFPCTSCLLFPVLGLRHIVYHKHTVQVSYWWLIWHQWWDLATCGFIASLCLPGETRIFCNSALLTE